MSTAVIEDFPAQRRLAFVGASHDPKEFSAGVHREQKGHGYEFHPVNPHAKEVDGACPMMFVEGAAWCHRWDGEATGHLTPWVAPAEAPPLRGATG